jgi:F0F1-type ATP synthase assembly protein I
MSSRPSAGPDNGKADDAEAADGRSAMAKATEWVSRIITISLGMVLPGLAGYWLDTKLGTVPLFLLVGFALGGMLAFGQLRAIAQSTKNRSTRNRRKNRTEV